MRMAKEYFRVLLYITRGGLRWVRSVHEEDQGAMKAEGQARLEPPTNPSCVSTGLCVCAAGCGMHTVRGNECPNGGVRESPTRGPFGPRIPAPLNMHNSGFVHRPIAHCIDIVLVLIPRVVAELRRKGGRVGLTVLMKKVTVGEMEGKMKE